MERVFTVLYLFLALVFCFELQAQNKNVKDVWRINVLNPSVEYELPTSNNSTLSSSLGIGYSVSYPHTDNSSYSGPITSFNPFLDIQHKWFYNFNKRKEKGLKTKNNAANFISTRMLARGETLFGNTNGTDGFDFAFGPTWGIQREYGKNLHFLFDLGPIYYFDTNGFSGFFPIMIQLNLGFNL